MNLITLRERLPRQLTAVPAHELDDEELRRELANTHQLEGIISAHGNTREQAMMSLRLAELDSEYLRRYPAAAERWPWPLPD